MKQNLFILRIVLRIARHFNSWLSHITVLIKSITSANYQCYKNGYLGIKEPSGGRNPAMCYVFSFVIKYFFVFHIFSICRGKNNRLI